MLPEIFLALQVHHAFDFNIVTDEPLHPMVQEALQADEPMPPYDDNAHVYLMGVVAAEGDDSFEVGKKRFISLKETYQNHERRSYTAYPKEKWHQLKSDPRMCTFSSDEQKQKDCIKKLRLSCEAMSPLLGQYQYALNNYQKVINAPKIMSPSENSTVDWGNLEIFRLLGMLDGMHFNYRFVCNKETVNQQVIEKKVSRVESLRKLYAETDDFAVKVVLLLILRDFYQWQVYDYRSNVSQLRELPEAFFSLQTEKESGLRVLMQAMIRDHVNLLKIARQNASHDGGDTELAEWFFKEKLTINDMSLIYRNLILDSELPINRYLRDRKPKLPRPYFKWWRIGNYSGEIINMVATPRFISVVEDLNNLDLIIRLSDIAINYSELVENQRLEGLPLTKRNPYDNSLPFFDESGQWLCFKVPEELKSQDECIYLN